MWSASDLHTGIILFQRKAHFDGVHNDTSSINCGQITFSSMVKFNSRSFLTLIAGLNFHSHGKIRNSSVTTTCTRSKFNTFMLYKCECVIYHQCSHFQTSLSWYNNTMICPMTIAVHILNWSILMAVIRDFVWNEYMFNIIIPRKPCPRPCLNRWFSPVRNVCYNGQCIGTNAIAMMYMILKPWNNQ